MHPGRRRARRLGRIEREILENLSIGDLAYGFFFSARSTKLMHKLARERAMDRYRRKQALERLLEDKFVSESEGRLSITKKGTNALGVAVSKTAKLLGTKWDGRWRIVIFDIPEEYVALRNRVRSILKRAGFAQLQLSVWIFPYECHELVRLIKEESHLSKYILYGVLESMENAESLKKHFKL